MTILPLLDFVPALSTRFMRPTHLAPVAERLERVLVEPVRLFFSAPPRMSKTELEIHLIPWLLLQAPHLRIGFVSYSQRIAERKSLRAMQLAERAGVSISKDEHSKSNWRTGVEDGGVWATSPEGSAAGEGFEVLIVDDAIANRAHAESSTERDALFDWFNDVAFTRLEPEGSIIASHTRWHLDDLGGRLIAQGWDHVNLPALDADGKSLWPERWTEKRLEQIRAQIGEYGWSSLYMGDPRPRIGSLFKDARFYNELPRENVRYAIGIDLAYSTRTKSDFSIAIVLAEHDGKYFVVDVVRAQVQAPEFRLRVQALVNRYHVTPSSYVSGTERGTLDMFASLGTVVTAKTARDDKFVRAQPVAAAWNAGNVLVPHHAAWLDDFTTELLAFTGTKDKHDDQIDALAAAFDSVFKASFGSAGFRSAFVQNVRAQLGSVFTPGDRIGRAPIDMVSPAPKVIEPIYDALRRRDRLWSDPRWTSGGERPPAPPTPAPDNIPTEAWAQMQRSG